MGKLISKFRAHSDEGSNNLKDEKRYNPSEPTGDSTDEIHRIDAEKAGEPAEGWEEICSIGIDVLQDVMTDKKHRVVQTGPRRLREKIVIPTMEENRARLMKAHELWIKHRRPECRALLPNWELILNRPVLEQSYLVEVYVKKVFRLLELEDLPFYDVPEDIPKEEILIRDPNMPAFFITLADALEKQKRKRKIDVGDLMREDLNIENLSFPLK